MRRALPVLLLLALLLQQLVWPLLPSQTTRTAEMLAHVSIHLDAIGHHHHSDSALLERLDDWLTDYLAVEKTEYSALVGRWFFIAMVDRAMNPGGQFKYCLILEGLQDALKRDGMIWVSWPKKAAKVPTSDTGTASIGISVARQFCRKRKTTINTSASASKKVWTTSVSEAWTKTVLSSTTS